MNKLIYLLGITVLGIAAVSFAFTQAPPNQAASSAMMGMANHPIRAAVVTAFVLPELQTELALSAQQVSELKRFKQELVDRSQDLSKQIAAKDKELAATLALGAPKNEDVKRLLEQIANLRAQQEFAAFETAGKMKSSLSDQQRTKLAAMTPYELHQAAMSAMTAGDMNEMMRFMGGAADMTGRSMMNGQSGRGMMGRRAR